jgi:hypothetical protein
VFEQCCQIKSKDISKVIEQNQLGNVNAAENIKTYPTLVEASSKFIRGLSEQLILQYCSLSESIASK